MLEHWSEEVPETAQRLGTVFFAEIWQAEEPTSYQMKRASDIFVAIF
jgi:hypothetical protein